MAYWARIGENNIVEEVTVGDSVDWLEANIGGTWLETFADGSQRYNFAGRGFTYDSELDAFIPAQPFASWLLDEETCQWQPPVPMPSTGGPYTWDEEVIDWVLVEV